MLVYGVYWPGTTLPQWQAIVNAERPLCAAVSAASWWCAGNQFMGPAASWTEEQIENFFREVASRYSVPQTRFELWVRGLLGEKLGEVCTDPIDRGDRLYAPSSYQCAAVQNLTVAGGILAFDVGLGKTLTACVAAREYARRVGSRRCWVLCPLIAMSVWKSYVPVLRSMFEEVEVFSIDSAHKLLGVDSARGGVLIVDEAHMVGDTKTRRTSSVLSIRPAFDCCICLTGTLLHAGVERVLPVLDVAVPGGMRFASKWKVGEYFRCLVRKRIGRRTVTAIEKPPAAYREAFFSYVASLAQVVSRDHPDVRDSFELPGQECSVVEVCKPWVSLDEAVAQYIDTILETGESVPEAMEVMHALARANAREKLHAWEEYWRKEPNEPWVLFSHYRSTLDEIESFVKRLGLRAARIDGATSHEERARIQAEFQAGNLDVVVGQMTAAGQSIDLFRARFSATIDVSWKAVDYCQALGRTHRRGQTRPCVHYDFVANVLQKRIIDKLKNSQDFTAEAAEWQLVRTSLARRTSHV